MINKMTNQAEILSSKPFVLRLILWGLPKATNALLGANKFVKHNNAKSWKQAVAFTVGYRKPNRPLERVQLSFIRHSWRTLDFDGLTASMKPIADGLVDCGVLKNDNWSITGPWKIDQKFREKKNGSYIEILVEEII